MDAKERGLLLDDRVAWLEVDRATAIGEVRRELERQDERDHRCDRDVHERLPSSCAGHREDRERREDELRTIPAEEVVTVELTDDDP